MFSCYGAETGEMPCCSTCEEVREAYRKKGWAISNPKVRWCLGRVRGTALPLPLCLQEIAQCVDEGWTDKLRDQVSLSGRGNPAH